MIFAVREGEEALITILATQNVADLRSHKESKLRLAICYAPKPGEQLKASHF